MHEIFSFSELIDYLSKEGISFKLSKQGTNFTIRGFSELSDTKPETVTWMKRNIANWDEIQAAVVICPIDTSPPQNSNVIFIQTGHPRLVFSKILNEFSKQDVHPKVDETASISASAEIGENVHIGRYAVIGENVTIGKGTIIYDHVTIYPNTEIKENGIIHSGAVLGGDGFGYVRDEFNKPIKIKHIGGLLIHEDVEIGCNSCIDRGTLSNTIIGANTKISNQCNISHNVSIGERVMICAKACVNGSTTIKDDVWISPGSVINNGLLLEKNCTVGSGAVVIKDVKQNDVVAGVPAKSIKKM